MNYHGVATSPLSEDVDFDEEGAGVVEEDEFGDAGAEGATTGVGGEGPKVLVEVVTIETVELPGVVVTVVLVVFVLVLSLEFAGRTSLGVLTYT